MKCGFCGTEVADGVSFCPHCGDKIEGPAKTGLKLAPSEQDTATAAQSAPAQGSSMYGYNGNPAPGNVSYGYNGNPVVGNIMPTSGNMPYTSISMDANEPLMDLNEYYRKDCSPKTKQYVKTGYIILYVFGIINLILAIVTMNMDDTFMWKSSTGDGMLYIDPTLTLVGGAVLLVGAIGVHKMKSRVFAGITLAYAVFVFIRNIMITHKTSGWLILLAAVYAFYGTWTLHKDYERYKSMKTMIR